MFTCYYGLQEEIDTISDRRIDLSYGGYLVIDYAEAMTVIDVNSGRYSSRKWKNYYADQS